MPKIHTYFDPPGHEGYDFTNDVSLTQQSFAADADINNMIAKYNSTGIFTGYTVDAEPIFDDFTAIPDFQNIQNQVVRANEMFMSLAPKVRERFNNDPALLISFLSNSDNRKEAENLGLVNIKVESHIDSASIPPVGSQQPAGEKAK